MDANISPAGPAPPGVVPDLVHPDSFASVSVGTMTTFIVVTSIAIAIKLFTKIHIVGKVSIDDYMLVLAALLGIAFDLLFCAPETTRDARHMWERSRSSVELQNQIGNAGGVIWFVAVLLANASIILQLQHFFATERYSKMWWVVQIFLWTNTLVYTAATLVMIVICTPQAEELNVPVTYLVTSAISIALNCSVLSIPLLGLWTLRIAARQKAIVMAMFSVNLLAVGCAIGRMTVSAKIIHSNDKSRDSVIAAYWGAAELVFFILAAVFPSLPRFWQWCRGRDFRLTEDTGCQFAKSTYTKRESDRSSPGMSNSAPPVCPFAAAQNVSLVPADKGTNTTLIGSNGPCRFATCRPDEEGILRTVEVEVTSIV